MYILPSKQGREILFEANRTCVWLKLAVCSMRVRFAAQQRDKSGLINDQVKYFAKANSAFTIFLPRRHGRFIVYQFMTVSLFLNQDCKACTIFIVLVFLRRVSFFHDPTRGSNLALSLCLCQNLFRADIVYLVDTSECPMGVHLHTVIQGSLYDLSCNHLHCEGNLILDLQLHTCILISFFSDNSFNFLKSGNRKYHSFILLRNLFKQCLSFLLNFRKKEEMPEKIIILSHTMLMAICVLFSEDVQ